MLYPFRDPPLQAYFGLSTDYAHDREQLYDQPKLITILWNRNEEAVELTIDHQPRLLGPQEVLTFTYLQQVDFPHEGPALTAYTFNREFYCIMDHDHEVSCNGIIFFGTTDVPLIQLHEEEQRKFGQLHDVFLDEFSVRDRIQGEMLRMLLKRLIIKATRLAQDQQGYHQLEETQVDMVRKFKVMVDLHFREKKQVSDYADLLFRSPKTLSNAFAKLGQPSPLSLIQERIVLEGKRLLLYSDKTSKEIALELGYDQVSSFGKLFKRLTGQTPMAFRAEQAPVSTEEEK